MILNRPLSLWFLFFFMMLLALGGFYGGIVFLIDPSGELMQMAPEVLPTLPIPDYTLPGLFLLLIMGIAPMILLYGLISRPGWRWTTPFVNWSRKHWSWTGTLYLSFILILWLIIEAFLIGFKAPVQIITALINIAIMLLLVSPQVRQYYHKEFIENSK